MKNKKSMKSAIITFLLVMISSGLSLVSTHNTQTTLKFSTWGSQTEMEILQPMIKDFEKQNPKVKVMIMHTPQNYFQKLHLLFASKAPLDVVFINNLYLPFYANANMLKPLDMDVSEFEPKALQALTYNDKLYAIPRDISLLVMFRNKDLFKKCNVDLNKSSETFNEFLIASKKFKQCGVFGTSFETNPIMYMPYLMSEGGGILGDDKKTNIFHNSSSQKGLNFYTDLRKKYQVAPTASESANLTMAQMFLQQKVAMQLSGHWLVPKYTKEATFNWDTTTFPKGSKGSIVSLDASGWAITANSKHPKEAKKLIEFLSSKENIEKFADSGLIVPARKDVLTGTYSQVPVNKAFIKAIETAKPTPVSTDYNTLLDSINQETDKLFN
jgi:multiple sugar transport system substrate-binding protein